MKLLKVIGMILLIAKASIGLSLPMTFTSGQSCCTEMSVDMDCSDSEDEKKGCCDSSACDCLCCGHIFTFVKSFQLIAAQTEVILYRGFLFNFNYTSSPSEGIWQPPRAS